MATQRTYRKNIRLTLQAASADDHAAGLTWYHRARTVAASFAGEYGIPLRTAAAILAITSQGTSWSANVTKTRKALAQHAAGERIHRIGMRAESKIERALAGDPDGAVSGPKLTAFYRSIMGEDSGPVVDRWAARIARGGNPITDDGRVTPREYREIARAYEAVARETTLTPRELQAITWTAFRRVNARAIYDIPEVSA